MKSNSQPRQTAIRLLSAAFILMPLGSIAAPKKAAPKAKENPAPFWLSEGDRPDPTPPTRSDIPYGTDPKQVMDFWKAESSKPTPLVFFIHGGGWKDNDKNKVTG
jgi:acetyl esterase/lipase